MQVTLDLADAPIVIPRQAPKEMMSVRVDENGVTHVRINYSSLDLIQSCLRKTKYSLIEKWKPETESPATVFGSGVHKALEIYYTGKPEERLLPSLEDCEASLYSADEPQNLILRAIRGFKDKVAPLAQLPDMDKRSIVNGVWILHNYFKAYINDPYITYIDKDGPFVERQFSHIIHADGNLVIELFGTIDFAFQHMATGAVIPGDHKTTSSLGWGSSSYFDRERPNHQYTGYLLGAREKFGIESNDFIVNVIEVKARPKTARGSAPSFPRQLTTRAQSDFDELREVLVENVELYLRNQKSGLWPLGPVGSCNAYGACQYKQVCAAPRDMRENILNVKFKREM